MDKNEEIIARINTHVKARVRNLSLTPQQPAAVAAIDQLIAEASRLQRERGRGHQARAAFFAVEPRDGPTAAARTEVAPEYVMW
jgi:hypothetical protein